MMANRLILRGLFALLALGAGCITTADESLGALQHDASAAVPEAAVAIELDAGHELHATPSMEQDASGLEPDVGMFELDAADHSANEAGHRDAGSDAGDAHAPDAGHDAGHDAGRSLECIREPWECR